MKISDYEYYTECIDYKKNLREVQEKIAKNSRTQFGGKAMIGNDPAKFYAKLKVLIDEECKRISEKQENI